MDDDDLGWITWQIFEAWTFCRHTDDVQGKYDVVKEKIRQMHASVEQKHITQVYRVQATAEHDGYFIVLLGDKNLTILKRNTTIVILAITVSAPARQ